MVPLSAMSGDKESYQLHVTFRLTHAHTQESEFWSVLCCFFSNRTDAEFVPWPIASTVSKSKLCLRTVEA